MSVTELSSRRAAIVPEIHRALRKGVDEEVFPGGAAAVFLDGKLVHLSSTGDAQRVPAKVAMADDALFDLASLTKVLATTPAVALLVARRQIDLDDPVVRFVPAFGRGGKREVTVRHLLAHSAGLPAWKPFFLDVMRDAGGSVLFRRERPSAGALDAAIRRGRSMVYEAVDGAALEREPGRQAVYSDLGFLALGQLVEAVTAERLDAFVERELFGELKVPTLAYRPLGGPLRAGSPLVATGVRRPREPAPGQEGLLPPIDPAAPPEPRAGEVDDDNAYAMGGVAGHAGLFGTVRDVAAFGALLLEEHAGACRLAPPEVWRTFFTRDATPGSTRALGFDTPSEPGSSAGRHLAASRAVGHLGFTGTSLWLDLDRSLAIALLTNRVHPSRGNEKIRAFRPAFHEAVVEALALG